jgi:hypothetical protein
MARKAPAVLAFLGVVAIAFVSLVALGKVLG